MEARKMKRRLKKAVVLILVCMLTVLSIPTNVFAMEKSEEEYITVDFGKEFNLQDALIDHTSAFDRNYWYAMKVKTTDNGRIRVWIRNVSNPDDLEWCCINTTGPDRKWNIKGDTANSGWISLDKTEAIFRFSGGNTLGESTDSTILVEFESATTCNGEIESNDDFDTATPIQSGITYYGDYSKNTYSYYECDYYQFDMPDSGLVKMVLKNEKESTSMKKNADYEIYYEESNGNKKLLVSKSASWDKLDSVAEEYLRLPKGRYYINVEPDNLNCVEYSLNVDYSTNEVKDYYEKEFNNYSSTANPIEIDQWYMGNFNTENDIDWFRLETDGSSRLNIEFKIPGHTNANVILYDEEFNIIRKISTRDDSYYKTDAVVKPAGIYYVKVMPIGDEVNNRINYSIKVNADVIIKPVTNLKAKHTSYNKLKLTWKKSQSAAGYNIYSRKGNSKVLTKRGFTTECEFNIKSLADGSKYTFIVEPCVYKEGQYVPASYAQEEITTYTLCKVTQNAPKMYSSSKVKISWKNVNGANGYEISKLAKRNGKFVTVSCLRTSKASLNVSAEKKDTYYYKVRAFKSVDGKKVYAPWSSLKSYQLK